jgi:hypothetical protein
VRFRPDKYRIGLSPAAILASTTPAVRARMAEGSVPFPEDLPYVVGDDVEFTSRNSQEIRRGTLTAFLPKSRCLVTVPKPPSPAEVHTPLLWQIVRVVPASEDSRRTPRVGDAVTFPVLNVRRHGTLVAVVGGRGVTVEPPSGKPYHRPSKEERDLFGPRNTRQVKRLWEPHVGDIRRVWRDGVEVARLSWLEPYQEPADPRIAVAVASLSARNIPVRPAKES